MTTCNEPGCDRDVLAKGKCRNCYYIKRRAEERLAWAAVEYTCPQCKRLFHPKTSRAVYCGPPCKDAARVREWKPRKRMVFADRPCAVCGTPFTPTNGTGKTCGPKCKNKLQNDRKQAAKRAAWNANKKPCARCGDEIPESRRASSKYCKPECNKLAMDARWRETKPGYQRQVKYGMSDEQYEAMLVAQEYRCAICRTDEPGGKDNKLHVDHDHETGQVRGLLCNACNNGLGRFKDDPARLRSAADYLERCHAVRQDANLERSLS